MKVRIGFTVDIDPAAWQIEYGVEDDDIRADVKRYAEESIRAQFDSLGLLADGELFEARP